MYLKYKVNERLRQLWEEFLTWHAVGISPAGKCYKWVVSEKTKQPAYICIAFVRQMLALGLVCHVSLLTLALHLPGEMLCLVLGGYTCQPAMYFIERLCIINLVGRVSLLKLALHLSTSNALRCSACWVCQSAFYYIEILCIGVWVWWVMSACSY